MLYMVTIGKMVFKKTRDRVVNVLKKWGKLIEILYRWNIVDKIN